MLIQSMSGATEFPDTEISPDAVHQRSSALIFMNTVQNYLDPVVCVRVSLSAPLRLKGKLSDCPGVVSS